MSFQKINSQDTTRSIEQVSIMAYGYNEKELKILNDFCHKQSINNMIVVNNEILDMTLEDILSGTVSPSPSPPSGKSNYHEWIFRK
ncbi:MAG: hypothetical protein GX308_04070 [Epulopiscium sp.]|nr:hypothetical protein [Candidatus Epulonipiscium sp.]